MLRPFKWPFHFLSNLGCLQLGILFLLIERPEVAQTSWARQPLL